MTERQQRLAALGIAGLAFLLIAARRYGRGTVLIGPVTVKQEKASLGLATATEVQRSALALAQSRKFMGADPNTLASRQPAPAEQEYIRQTLQLARSVAQKMGQAYNPAEDQRFALALTLPGDSLQQANRELYVLLGIDPEHGNTASVPLTPAIEQRARSLIAQWRPYSQDAVDTLFVHLDDARALAQGLA